MTSAAAKKKVLLYIDNSNVFIPAMKQQILKDNFYHPHVTQDMRVRMEYGKLYEIILGNRETLKRPILYGSVPPQADSLWKKIESKEIEVKTFEKSKQNQEKRTDSELVADAVFDMACFWNLAEEKIVVLCTGDQDMMAVLPKAQITGFKVEIWSFKSAISNEFRHEAVKAIETKDVIVKYLDDFYDEIAFLKKKWTNIRNIPEDRTIVLCFHDEHKQLVQQSLERTVDTASKIFKQPTQGCFLRQENFPQNIAIVLLHEADYFKVKNPNNFTYNFDADVWSRATELMRNVVGCISIKKYKGFIEQFKPIVEEVDEPVEPKSEIIVEGPKSSEKDGWEMQTKKTKKQKCPLEFRCLNEKFCGGSHSKEQREFFAKFADDDDRKYYKTKSCVYDPCGNNSKPHMCRFAHGKHEIFCLKCSVTGDHSLFNCPKENLKTFKA